MSKKNGRWSYFEDELCCKLYIEKFLIEQSNMTITEFVKILSSRINRSSGTIRMKVQNIKQIVIDKGLIDSLQVTPLAHYSPQNLIIFENLLWNPSDFQIKNNILICYNGDDERVTIPKNVVKIGEDAFKGCDMVRHIEIPEGCIEISKGALDCKNLKTVVLPSTLKQLDRRALHRQEVDYPETAYYNYISKDIIIFSRSKSPVGEGQEIHIYKENLDKNDALTNLRRCRYAVYFNYDDLNGCTKDGLYWYKTLDGSITIIGKKKKNKSEPILIPEKIKNFPVKRIGDYAFRSEYLGKGEEETIILSKDIEVIGVGAFKHYKGEVNINEKISIIGEEAFFQCNKCPSRVGAKSAYLLRLPKTVERIEKCAFVGCTFSLLIPGTIYFIGAFAFYKMGGIKQEASYSWKKYYPVICFTACDIQDWRGDCRVEMEENDEEIVSNLIPSDFNWGCGWDKNWKEGLGLDTIVLDVENIKECMIGEFGEKKLSIKCKKRQEERVVFERESWAVSVD